MNKELIFQILAAILLIAAAYLYWNGNNDAAFFCLVLSACSFFFNIRFLTKARLASSEQDTDIEDSSR